MIKKVKRKGGRNFETAHRGDMLKGQQEKEAADRKGKSAQGSPMAEHLGARNSARSGL